MTTTETVPAATAEGRQPLMTLEGVTQVFDTKAGPITAVDHVNLSINPGEVLCLVGESGSGKTTAARMAAGLARPSGGHVNYDGKDIWSLNRRDFKTFRRGVQYVHQDPYASLNPTRTILQTITAPLVKHGVVKGKRAAIQKAAELLTEVDLTPPENYLDKYPHQLSGGQRQRVAVARALTLDPKIIIADESTSMLECRSGSACWRCSAGCATTSTSASCSSPTTWRSRSTSGGTARPRSCTWAGSSSSVRRRRSSTHPPIPTPGP